MNVSLLPSGGQFAGSRSVRASALAAHPWREYCWFWVALLAAFLTGRSAAALTVTPSTIDNAYNGTVVLNITGVSTGQRVLVEKFFDVDNNSTITAGTDLLVQRFKVTDGQATSVGGRKNINVPADDDGLPGTSIQTTLYFTPGELVGRLDGRFIYRVSADSGTAFTPFTGTLMVTQKAYGGSSIGGRIMAGAVAQSNAIVLITSGAAGDFDVKGMTKTNATGNFSFNIPAGSYRPVPVKSGFVFNFGTSSLFTVNNGANTAAGDILLTTRTRTISGQVRDNAGSPVTLGGMLVYSEGEPGIFSFTFSDASGNYVVDAGAGETGVGVLERQCAVAGVIGVEDAAGAPAGAGNVTGVNITLPRPTALIFGNARTPASAAVPWLDIDGEMEDAVELSSTSVTDATGYYTLGVVIGDWQVASETPGYLVTSENVDVNIAGTNVLQDITARIPTAHLRGTVRDNQNQVVPNLEVLAHDFQGSSSYSITDANGNFDLPVYGGTGGTGKLWSLQLNQGGDGEPAAYIAPTIDYQVTDGNDINNINFGVYAVTAHLRGTVRDENDAPVGGVNIFATSQPGGVLTGTSPQGDGSFDMPVFGGTWRFGLSNDAGPGWLAQNNLQVTTTDGNDVNNLVFRLRRTNSTISGTLKNTQGAGLTGVNIYASTTISGAQFSTSTTTTAGGNYSLNVFSAATWQVTADSGQLGSQGYQPVSGQDVFVNGGNATVNFTATTGGGGTTFTSWQASKFTAAELLNPSISGPGADPDGDGVPNLMEYAVNLQPKSSDAAGMPQPGTLTEGPNRFLTLTFRRLKNATGLAYNVQEATLLNGAWGNVQASYELISSDATTDTMRAKTPLTPGTDKFMRLNVVQQP